MERLLGKGSEREKSKCELWKLAKGYLPREVGVEDVDIVMMEFKCIFLCLTDFGIAVVIGGAIFDVYMLYLNPSPFSIRTPPSHLVDKYKCRICLNKLPFCEKSSRDKISPHLCSCGTDHGYISNVETPNAC